MAKVLRYYKVLGDNKRTQTKNGQVKLVYLPKSMVCKCGLHYLLNGFGQTFNTLVVFLLAHKREV